MTERIPPVSNIIPLKNHLKKKFQDKKKSKRKFELPPMPPDDAG